MRDRSEIIDVFKHTRDYRRCPDSTKLIGLEVLFDIRDLLVEVKNGLIDVENKIHNQMIGVIPVDGTKIEYY